MTKFNDFLKEQLVDPEVKAAYDAVIKNSGDRTLFSTGSVRDIHEGKGRLDLLPCSAILELAKHCENGALKYGERNVDKGIPQHSFIDSGLRHLFKYLRGDKDENHLVAALWNIAWAVNQEVEKPEMQDIPSRMEEEKCNTENRTKRTVKDIVIRPLLRVCRALKASAKS